MKFFAKWEPKDVVALVVILVLGTLLALGRDSILTTLFSMVITAYIGIDISLLRKRRK